MELIDPKTKKRLEGVADRGSAFKEMGYKFDGGQGTGD